MKRKAPSPRLEAAATYQAWAADEDGSPRGTKPPIKKLRERLASVDVLDEVATAEASWGPLEGTAAVVGTGSLDVRRVFEVVVNLLDDEKKRELRAVEGAGAGAGGGRRRGGRRGGGGDAAAPGGAARRQLGRGCMGF